MIKTFKSLILLIGFAAVAVACLSVTVAAQTPIALLESRNGRYNIISTGGTLRSQPNTSNACSRVTTSTAALSGLPATATVTKAYLYWAGSGQTPDNSVSFDGTTYNADRTFSAVYNLAPSNFYFFGAVKDVTAKVQARRNANYAFTNLTFQTTDVTGQPYCTQEAVMGGWALYVIYQDAAESPKRVNLYEGFELFRNSSRTLTLNGLNVPPSPTGKMSVLAWEGDPSLSGGGENFSFNGTSFIDALNPSGNVFNSTINGLNNANTHGVDLDTFDISSSLVPGSSSASATIATGNDLVLLNAVAVSGSTTVADLELTKTVNTATASEGQTIAYTLSVFNRGPNPSSTSQIRDVLPAGLTYVSSATTNGSYNPATGIWTTSTLAVNSTSTLTINATVNSGTSGTTIQNIAQVFLADNFDPDSTENNNVTTEDDYSAVSVNIRPNADVSIVKTGPAAVNLGQAVQYTIQVSNAGPTNVTGLTIADIVPAGVTVSGWTCAPTGTASCGTASGTTGNISLSGNINSGAANRLTITVNGTATTAGVITNTATVTLPATLNDSNQANNTSSVTTTIGISVAGRVWQDADGSANGTFTNIQTGAEVGTNAGGLFALAVDSGGLIIASGTVAANGVFTINGVTPNAPNITLRLATTAPANGQSAPAPTLPAGWTNTSPLATANFNTATTNITGRDFGIERLPTAVGAAAATQPNPGATNSVAIPPAILTGTDPDGTIASFTITAFPSNATSVTIGGSNYTSANFPVAGVVVTAVSGAFPANGATIDPVDGVTTVGIQFIVTDNAGKPSTASATATMPFSGSLPPNVTLAKSCPLPANCESANQLPGTDLTYSIVFTNTGGQSAQGLTILDAIPLNTDFKVGTAAATSPAGMIFTIEYSYDYNPATPAAATWTTTAPVSAGGGASAGYNSLVRAIRWRNTAGGLTNAAPNNTGNVSFVVKIR